MEERDYKDWEEQELRSKLCREQEARRPVERTARFSREDEAVENRGWGKNTPTENHCFNCNQIDHFRKDCTNPTFCYCCKKSGHRAPVCPDKRGMRVCGFEIPGQGFY